MMKPSEFQTTIENQFDYICKVAMEDERKDYLKALSRQCKRETLFCDMTITPSICFLPKTPIHPISILLKWMDLLSALKQPVSRSVGKSGRERNVTLS